MKFEKRGGGPEKFSACPDLEPGKNRNVPKPYAVAAPAHDQGRALELCSKKEEGRPEVLIPFFEDRQAISAKSVRYLPQGADRPPFSGFKDRQTILAAFACTARVDCHGTLPPRATILLLRQDFLTFAKWGRQSIRHTAWQVADRSLASQRHPRSEPPGGQERPYWLSTCVPVGHAAQSSGHSPTYCGATNRMRSSGNPGHSALAHSFLLDLLRFKGQL